MNLKQIAKDTAKTLQSYLTYQALRTVLAQLGETNPPLALWLHNFSAGKVQDGERYIAELLREQPDLALRIMTVRENIAEEIVEYLPEMIRTGIQQSNMEQRRQHLERMTRLSISNPSPESESQTFSDPDRDNFAS